ncbi:hypothetical protein ACPV52_09920 [Vibrio astriarenae]
MPYASTFSINPLLGRVCLECGANSVDVDHEQQTDAYELVDYRVLTCRVCGNCESEELHRIEIDAFDTSSDFYKGL